MSVMYYTNIINWKRIDDIANWLKLINVYLYIKEFIPFNASNVEVFHSSYLQMHVNVGSPSCQAQKQIYVNEKP
jgi:hypothetical protein